MTWWINVTNKSAYKQKQCIITRRRRATHVIDMRQTRELREQRATKHANGARQRVLMARDDAR
jgi:ABC-type taurine transport system ATPase subunit